MKNDNLENMNEQNIQENINQVSGEGLLQETPETTYGGFWIRFLAILADSAIISFVGSILIAVPSLIRPQYTDIISLIVFLASIFYYVGMQSSRHQATIGKKLAGLRVQRAEDGSKISFWRSFGRELSKILSAIPGMLGFVMAGFTKRKQALHDMTAGTVIIKHKPAKIWALLLIILGPAILQVILVMFVFAGSFFALSSFTSGFDSISIDESSVEELSEHLLVDDYLTAEEYEQNLASFDGEEEFYLEEPGVYVGPGVIELDSFFDNDEQDQISVYLPAIANLSVGKVLIYLDGVYDRLGDNILDVEDLFENDEFFSKVSFETWYDDMDYVSYYEGSRAIHYIGDDPTLETFQRLEGQMIIRLPLENGNIFEKVYPFVINN